MASESIVLKCFGYLVDGRRARKSKWSHIYPAGEIAGRSGDGEDIGTINSDRWGACESCVGDIRCGTQQPHAHWYVVAAQCGQGCFQTFLRSCGIRTLVNVEKFYPHGFIVHRT